MSKTIKGKYASLEFAPGAFAGKEAADTMAWLHQQVEAQVRLLIEQDYARLEAEVAELLLAGARPDELTIATFPNGHRQVIRSLRPKRSVDLETPS